MKGKITITRTTQGIEQMIKIEVIGDAREPVIRLFMTPEDFALAVTGMGYRECNYVTPALDAEKK